MKKQIVFIESKPTVYTYRIARTLKLTGKYKTLLVCFSELDKELFKNAYDKILILELSHKINFQNFWGFFKKIFSQKGRAFFREIKKMSPYIFQVSGPDLFSLMAMFFLKKSPKIYFAYDLWGLAKKNFNFPKNIRTKIFFQKVFERICFKMANGVLHKGRPGELKLLDYKVNIPDLSFVPGCLDEWICSPTKKKKETEEINLVYAGGPWESYYGNISFSKIVGKIISQKIHFSVFGDFNNEKERKLFYENIKNSKYFHICEKERADKLSSKISEYNYGILPNFYEESIGNSIAQIETADKLSAYIEAGLPIIVSNQFKFLVKIIEDNKIGFSIGYKDLKNLKRIIMKRDYKKMKENMGNAQEKFKLSKNIWRLEEFYKKVRGNNG